MTVYADVSEWQWPVNGQYPHPFFMFRALSEWGREDYNARQNLAWSLAARGGVLVNFGVYVIPCFISNDAILTRLDQLAIPADCVVMVDMESWGGQITGDRSDSLNDLVRRLRARQCGRADLVWGYGNLSDLAGIWPRRPDWLGVIVAGYGPTDAPYVNGRIGWQYTNGQENGTSLPPGAAPFGNCDMNRLDIPIPRPVVAAEGSIDEGEEDMPSLDEIREVIREELRADDKTDQAWILSALTSKIRGELGGTIQRVIQILTKLGEGVPVELDVTDLATDLATALGPTLARELVVELGKALTA